MSTAPDRSAGAGPGADVGTDTDTDPSPAPVVFGAEDPAQALQMLLAVLDLRREGPDEFTGVNQSMPSGRVFGGQVLAQSLRAAQATVDPDRPVHSLHGYFLRAGDVREPIRFVVDRLRDGRSFSARRVHAIQKDRPILSMISSFQAPAQGMDHQSPMPAVPAPADLPSLDERYTSIPVNDAARFWLRQRPVDLVHVETPIYLAPAAERSDTQHVWMRAVGALPDDPALHAAVLLFASDYSLLEPALRRNGRSWNEPGLKSASLDHAMWWHRPARADDWLLYAQSSPSASGARGLGLGRMYTADGVLAATVAQEGMLRVPV